VCGVVCGVVCPVLCRLVSDVLCRLAIHAHTDGALLFTQTPRESLG